MFKLLLSGINIIVVVVEIYTVIINYFLGGEL